MNIKLVQSSGRNIATGITQYYEQYWVFLDDEKVGVISFRDGAKFLPRRVIDPVAMKKITAVIEEALERQVLSKTVPPEIPEGMFDDEDEGKHYEDDFVNS